MTTNISSRTPEGVPNRCPICEGLICIEPSQPAEDAPCPRCGVLLWFIRTSSGVRVYEARAVSPVIERIAEMLGVRQDADPEAALSSFIQETGKDSLGIVELVMELEETFDVCIPDQEAEKMRTIGDVIDYLIRHNLQ